MTQEPKEEYAGYDDEAIVYFLRWHNKSKRLAWVKPATLDMVVPEEEGKE